MSSHKRPADDSVGSDRSSQHALEEGELPAPAGDHLFSPRRRHKRHVVSLPPVLSQHLYYILKEQRVDPEMVVIDTLGKANEYVGTAAPLPGHFMTYLPLSSSCPIYCFFKDQYHVVNDITLCFGASYMRRVLCAKFHGFTDWTTENNTFEAMMPHDEDGVERIKMYVACIHIAHKNLGDSHGSFSPTEAIGKLVYQFLDSGELFDLEWNVLECLQFKMHV